MKKSILTVLLSIVFFGAAFAETNNTSVASQTIQLVIAPSIQILNNNVQINSNPNQQSFTVRSNNGFTISVSTIEANQNVKLSVVDNQTEGKVSSNSMNLSATAKNLIANCNRGNDQTFAVNYKAKNNAGVIYTATQP